MRLPPPAQRPYKWSMAGSSSEERTNFSGHKSWGPMMMGGDGQSRSTARVSNTQTYRSNDLGGFVRNNHNAMRQFNRFEGGYDVEMQRSSSTTTSEDMARALMNYREKRARGASPDKTAWPKQFYEDDAENDAPAYILAEDLVSQNHRLEERDEQNERDYQGFPMRHPPASSPRRRTMDSFPTSPRRGSPVPSPTMHHEARRRQDRRHLQPRENDSHYGHVPFETFHNIQYPLQQNSWPKEENQSGHNQYPQPRIGSQGLHPKALADDTISLTSGGPMSPVGRLSPRKTAQPVMPRSSGERLFFGPPDTYQIPSGPHHGGGYPATMQKTLSTSRQPPLNEPQKTTYAQAEIPAPPRYYQSSSGFNPPQSHPGPYHEYPSHTKSVQASHVQPPPGSSPFGFNVPPQLYLPASQDDLLNSGNQNVSRPNPATTVIQKIVGNVTGICSGKPQINSIMQDERNQKRGQFSNFLSALDVNGNMNVFGDFEDSWSSCSEGGERRRRRRRTRSRDPKRKSEGCKVEEYKDAVGDLMFMKPKKNGDRHARPVSSSEDSSIAVNGISQRERRFQNSRFRPRSSMDESGDTVPSVEERHPQRSRVDQVDVRPTTPPSVEPPESSAEGSTYAGLSVWEVDKGMQTKRKSAHKGRKGSDTTADNLHNISEPSAKKKSHRSKALVDGERTGWEVRAGLEKSKKDRNKGLLSKFLSDENKNGDNKDEQLDEISRILGTKGRRDGKVLSIPGGGISAVSELSDDSASQVDPRSRQLMHRFRKMKWRTNKSRDEEDEDLPPVQQGIPKSLPGAEQLDNTSRDAIAGDDDSVTKKDKVKEKVKAKTKTRPQKAPKATSFQTEVDYTDVSLASSSSSESENDRGTLPLQIASRGRPMENQQMYVAYSRFSKDPQKVLQLCQHATIPPIPLAKRKRVLIKVEFSTVSPSDSVAREGLWSSIELDPYVIPGTAFVGTIQNVERKSGFHTFHKPSERVISLVKKGSNARYLLAHRDTLVRVPDGVNNSTAVCLPEAYLGAFQALHINQKGAARYKDKSLRGQSVLVLGGTSPTGQAVIELARAGGADFIYAPVREKHSQRIALMGGIPLSRDPQDWLTLIGRQISMLVTVNDSVYREEITFDHSRALSDDGRVVVIEGPAVTSHDCTTLTGSSNASKLLCLSAKQKFASRTHYFNVFDNWEHDRKQAKKDLAHLMKLLADHRINPNVLQRIPLSKVAKAQAIVGKKKMDGFIVCEPWQSDKN